MIIQELHHSKYGSRANAASARHFLHVLITSPSAMHPQQQ
jgi:hypothetical protein